MANLSVLLLKKPVNKLFNKYIREPLNSSHFR
jgi:hypothetical protein